MAPTANFAASASARSSGLEQDAAADSSGDEFSDDVRNDPHDPDSRAQDASTVPITAQKRRRVTRACDECRRKKIKCDGKQPCTHCTVYSYDCTYDQPSNRRRNPAPQVVEALEQRLKRAEAILKALAPNIDLDDPNLEALVSSGALAPSSDASSLPDFKARSLAVPDESPAQPRASQSGEGDLESMVGAAGQLDLDERGYWDYHGHSSGLSFIRRMRQQFGDILGPEQLMSKSTPFARSKIPSYSVDSPRSVRSTVDSPKEISPHSPDLPPREKALELCQYAHEDAATIMRVVHRPTFFKQFDRIYGLKHEDWTNDEHQFLPLLYSAMALGCLFGKDEQSDVGREGYEGVTDQGYKYFWAARQLMDITDCRDLTSLQAIIFMTMFLQCSAKLSTCYAYIGVALRSALRMGLHRSFKQGFTPIEAECRKRCFWVVKKMDAYVGALLGLPQTLADEDIDQDFPAELDDEYITETEYLPMPPGQVSLMAAANANYTLMNVVQKIVRYIYPIKGFTNQDQSTNTYRISYSTIRELEDELQAWLEKLPPIFQPGGHAEPRILRARNLLRIAYAQAQMMLYRPFLQYVSSDSQSKLVDQRSYACSAACVSVSRNIIHITAEMKKSGLLVGSYWFTMYTTFFAILTLIYYVLENSNTATTMEIMRDAREGKDTLISLAKRSMAADRCTRTLKTLFAHIDKAVANGEFGAPSRKREAPDQTPAGRGRGVPSTHAPGVNGAGYHNAEQHAAQGARHHSIAPRPKLDPRLPSSATSQAPVPVTPSSSLYNSMDSFGTHSPASFGNANGQPFLASQMGAPPEFSSHVADLSAMMFPSADPFAYPNPPMLTLEQNYPHGQHQNPFTSTLGPNSFMRTADGKMHMPAEDSLDVQLFGPLPTHLAAAPQPFANGQQHQGGGMTDTSRGDMRMPAHQFMAQPKMQDRIWDQRMTETMNDIFNGDDWQGQYPEL